jgi:hypothetical protein
MRRSRYKEALRHDPGVELRVILLSNSAQCALNLAADAAEEQDKVEEKMMPEWVQYGRSAQLALGDDIIYIEGKHSAAARLAAVQRVSELAQGLEGQWKELSTRQMETEQMLSRRAREWIDKAETYHLRKKSNTNA